MTEAVVEIVVAATIGSIIFGFVLVVDEMRLAPIAKYLVLIFMLAIGTGFIGLLFGPLPGPPGTGADTATPPVVTTSSPDQWVSNGIATFQRRAPIGTAVGFFVGLGLAIYVKAKLEA